MNTLEINNIQFRLTKNYLNEPLIIVEGYDEGLTFDMILSYYNGNKNKYPYINFNKIEKYPFYEAYGKFLKYILLD